MDSRSDKVIQLEWSTKKLKHSVSHAQDCLPFIAEDHEEKKYVQKEWLSSMKWAVAKFRLWKKARNERFADESEKLVTMIFCC